MKFSLIGCLRLKPFDEEADASIAGSVYWGSGFLSTAIAVNAFLSIGALLLAVFGMPDASIKVSLLVLAISSVVSGLEWNAGLKARALNQLFSTALILCGLLFFANAASLKSK
jgi:hypothetical protein